MYRGRKYNILDNVPFKNTGRKMKPRYLIIMISLYDYHGNPRLIDFFHLKPFKWFLPISRLRC